MIIIGGAVALFVIDNSAGSLFLVAVGLALLLVALLGRRAQLESLEILGAKIRVRDVIESRLDFANLVNTEVTDDPRRAEARQQARALQQLGVAYGLYQHIRETQPASDRRTATLDQLAERMQTTGRNIEFDAADVSSWFHNGDEALRVVALNLMLARKESRDLLAVLKTIDYPRSLFEQYYGLRLAQAMIPDLDRMERGLLAHSVTRALRRRRFRHDRHLVRISSSVLQQLEGHD